MSFEYVDEMRRVEEGERRRGGRWKKRTAAFWRPEGDNE